MAEDDTNQGVPLPVGAAEIIDTDYAIGQDNLATKVGSFGIDIHNPVFLISGLSIVGFVFYSLALPEQSAALFGWFAMLFAAGMSIGLMFYGVSEPMSHFGSSLGGVLVEDGVRTDWAPLGGAVGDQVESARLGLAATIFHWGLHPWAIYAIVALALVSVLRCLWPVSPRSSGSFWWWCFLSPRRIPAAL